MSIVKSVLLFIGVPLALAFILAGCGTDEHLTPLPQSIVIPPGGDIPSGGSGQPGGICTLNSDCTHAATGTAATCLPPVNGQAVRRCSFYQFSTTVTVATNVACYNGSGVQTRLQPTAANTPFVSDTTRNEAACVAQGVGSGQCTQSGVRGNNLPCAYTLNPGHGTSTWNQTPDPTVPTS